MREMAFKAGEVVLVNFTFIDNSESKIHPALIVFSDFNDIVLIGITSNLQMKGILLPKKDGLFKDSRLKLNYIFTMPKQSAIRRVCYLNEERKEVYLKLEEMIKKI